MKIRISGTCVAKKFAAARIINPSYVLRAAAMNVLKNQTKATFLVLLMLVNSVCSSQGAAQTKEQKAKAGILKYVKANFNDPSSYQVVESSKLFTETSVFTEEEEQKFATDSILLEMSLQFAKNEFANTQSDTSQSKLRSMLTKYDEGLAAIAMKKMEIEWNRKPIITGYNITHKYRARNAFGALVLMSSKYYLNTKFEVVSMVDPETEEEYPSRSGD
jgi:hypothetical protein